MTFSRPANWPTGWLHELTLLCPDCGDSANIHVTAETCLLITEDGTVDDGSHEYGDYSAASCLCGASGQFRSFLSAPSEREVRQRVADIRLIEHSGLPAAHINRTMQSRWWGLGRDEAARGLDAALVYWPGVTIAIEGSGLILRVNTDYIDGQEAADMLDSLVVDVTAAVSASPAA